MPFCNNCGAKVNEGAKFCESCGNSLANGTQAKEEKRREKYSGQLIKCPNCGGLLEAFQIKCPTCGWEIREAQSTTSVKQFAEEFKKLNEQRKGGSAVGNLMKQIGLGKDSTASQMENLIRTYAVPNTKEDVLEFLMLAISNIEPSAYENQNDKIAQQISNAWMAKVEQVWQKASISFESDADFLKLQKMYDEKTKLVKKSKGKRWKIITGCVIAYICLMLILAMMSNSSNKKKDALDTQLNAIVDEIQLDISNHDYDAALLKANKLRFDSSLSSNKAEQWDEQREGIIEMIKEKQAENK